jgi:hypothetical protein
VCAQHLVRQIKKEQDIEQPRGRRERPFFFGGDSSSTPYEMTRIVVSSLYPKDLAFRTDEPGLEDLHEARALNWRALTQAQTLTLF